MRVLIVGAGPAAAGAALALTKVPGVSVEVLDVGGRLEADHDAARSRMAVSEPNRWSSHDVTTIRQTAVATEAHRIPEKRIFGSDFPFRNFGQLDHLRSDGDVNSHVISGAYGGFSNTWGAQTMVFSEATFNDWPFPRRDLEIDYRAILATIPYSAESDDLAEFFPLWGDADALPPLSEEPDRILRAYERRRLHVRRRGVLLGKARLALRGRDCVSCGLCLTGCPYSLIYSASQTFDELVLDGRVVYRGGYLALKVGEEDGRPSVTARSLSSGDVETFHADKVFLACGALGTTRLVAQSLGLWTKPIHVLESAQFLVPFLSIRAIARLSQDNTFTLNQFNMILPFDEAGRDLVQIHGYPYNDAMDDALPPLLKLPVFKGLGKTLLKRLTVGLGYLPSWWSPGFDVAFEPPRAEAGVAEMSLTPSAENHTVAQQMLKSVTRRLVSATSSLGIIPVVPQISLSAPAKSYHFGGTFPHARAPVAGSQSDLLGRVHPWRHIHLVDASVFPTVPATTFTLSIMANAHRIARTALDDLHE